MIIIKIRIMIIEIEIEIMNTNLKMIFINRISRIIIRINKMINLMDI